MRGLGYTLNYAHMVMPSLELRLYVMTRRFCRGTSAKVLYAVAK